MRRACYLLIALLLAACGSSPKVSYYTLSDRSSGSAQPTVNLVVERFQTTEALGRSPIMIAASPTRIEYYATDHWVAGVGELVQRKLQNEFGPALDGRPTYTVSGKVTALEQVDRSSGMEARVAVEIVIRDTARKRYEPPILEHGFSTVVPVSGEDPDAVVQALSRGVEAIAAEIAAAVSSL